MRSPQEDFEHDLNTLKKYLLGARYFHALRALDFAEKYHSGFRKDGITPNFHHQVKIAFSLYDDRDLLEKAGLNPDEVIAEGILHDTYEDNQQLQLSGIAERFNPKIAMIVKKLSKVREGVQIATTQYYNELLEYPELIIVKLKDRQQNIETMLALKPEKFAYYFPETHHLLDVAKQAITRYPALEGCIQHARNQIKQYLHLISSVMQMVADGSVLPYIAALQKGSILKAPTEPMLLGKNKAKPLIPG